MVKRARDVCVVLLMPSWCYSSTLRTQNLLQGINFNFSNLDQSKLEAYQFHCDISNSTYNLFIICCNLLCLRDTNQLLHFVCSCMQVLGWRSAQDLEKLSKDDLKKLCGDAEGARVFSQFSVQKANWQVMNRWTK